MLTKIFLMTCLCLLFIGTKGNTPIVICIHNASSSHFGQFFCHLSIIVTCASRHIEDSSCAANGVAPARRDGPTLQLKIPSLFILCRVSRLIWTLLCSSVDNEPLLAFHNKTYWMASAASLPSLTSFSLSTGSSVL